jgi:EAL domain-containing protein (putative c-di-GMP-specific phosphodiesterase class I)
LQRLVALEPDIIKLDLELVRGIDHDPVRRSMARALVHFAADVGSKVVAEGVEAPRELNTLGELGVRLIQGFLIARPGDVGAIPESPWLLASRTPRL